MAELAIAGVKANLTVVIDTDPVTALSAFFTQRHYRPKQHHATELFLVRYQDIDYQISRQWVRPVKRARRGYPRWDLKLMEVTCWHKGEVYYLTVVVHIHRDIRPHVSDIGDDGIILTLQHAESLEKESTSLPTKPG